MIRQTPYMTTITIEETKATKTTKATMSNQQTTCSDFDDYSMGRADDNPNLPAAVEFGDGRKVSEEFFEVMYQIATEKGVSCREDHQ